MAEFNARARGNPLVRGIYLLGKVVIADAVGRKIAARAGNFCILHGNGLFRELVQIRLL